MLPICSCKIILPAKKKNSPAKTKYSKQLNCKTCDQSRRHTTATIIWGSDKKQFNVIVA